MSEKLLKTLLEILKALNLIPQTGYGKITIELRENKIYLIDTSTRIKP